MASGVVRGNGGGERDDWVICGLSASSGSS